MSDLLFSLPWALAALAALSLFRARPRLRDYPPRADDEVPHVTVIIPARNEAANIGACLATVLNSTYARFDVVVVDDGSVDGTGDIVRALEQRAEGKVRLVEGEPLPEGWIGKPWACWQGYQVAGGELLLFTDADTRHENELIARAVAALRREDAALVSVLAKQLLVGFWERLIMPHVLELILFRFIDLMRANRTGQPRDAIANGQFMLMRRDAYEAVGGHRAVRWEVVEDQRLAQRFVLQGRTIFLAWAEAYLETRMYRSLDAIVEGWSKNLASGSRASVGRWLRPIAPWLIAAFVLAFWVLPPVVLAAPLFTGWGAALRGWAVLATGASLVHWMIVLTRFGVPLLYAAIYPAGAFAAAMLFVRSAIRAERVEWKGREYRLESRL